MVKVNELNNSLLWADYAAPFYLPKLGGVPVPSLYVPVVGMLCFVYGKVKVEERGEETQRR